MPQYVISFPDGAMQISAEDLPEVARAANAVGDEAKAAGAWVYGAGAEHQVSSVVAPDGTITDGPYPEAKEHLGGFAIVDVATREEALQWAAKIAAACRCPQEVVELLPDDYGQQLIERQRELVAKA